MKRLTKRADYQAVARGVRVSRRSVVVQARRRAAGDDRSRDVGPRFGFTVTRKVGNAVVRNRIRRRLREAVRLAASAQAAAATDYVLIGRRAALSESFERLVAEIVDGLAAATAAAARSRQKAERTNGTHAG